MPVTALSDNKQSVKVLLMSGIQHAFLIPEYQRPYAWTFDQVDTLFSDIWDFTESTGGPEREATYFLGSIVSFINEKGEQEIIDGQQRITSLFLLLRAIYVKIYEKDGLHSINPKYSVIGVTDDDNMRLIGRVVGLVDPDDMASEAEAKELMEVFADELD